HSHGDTPMIRSHSSHSAARLSRRDWLRLAAAGVVGTSTSGWLGALADDTARNPQRKRSCVLLWMSGGPSQLDTFDLKPGHAHGAGFLGPRTAPLIVGESGFAPIPQAANNADRALRVQDLAPPGEVGPGQADARVALLQQVQRDFLAAHPDVSALSHQSAYERAVRLVRSAAAKAFDLDDEKSAARDAYGRNLFGRGCLLARRLVGRQVPFVDG